MTPYNVLQPWQHGETPDPGGWARWQDYLRQGHGGFHGHGHSHGHGHGHTQDAAKVEPAKLDAPHQGPALDPGHQPADHPSGPHEHGGSDSWLHAFDHASGGLGGPIAVMPIDHLTLNNNSFVQNHITENSSIVFNAAPGGDIDVGGNVNALSAQHAEVQSVSASHGFGSELGWGDSAWGEAGGFDHVLVGHLAGLGGEHGPIVIMPVDHLTINNNTLVQNFQVENTNVTFNAGTGSSIDVGGNVSSLSDQTGHFGQDAHAHDAHALLA